MHSVLRCPDDTFSSDIFPMEMYYSVWINNQISGMNYILSDIEIWSRSRFYQV